MKFYRPRGVQSRPVYTKAAALKIFSDLQRSRVVALDTETHDPRAGYRGALRLDRARILVVSLKSERIPAVTMVSQDADPSGLPLSFLCDQITKLFSIDGIKFVFHNANYDLNVLMNHGILPPKSVECTLMMSHAIADRRKSLKNLAPRVGMYLRKTGSVDFSNSTELSIYGAEDVQATYLLYNYFNQAMSTNGDFGRLARKAYHKLDRPLIPIILGMERSGIRIDKRFFRNLERKLTRDRDRMYQKLYEYNGEPFNVRSTVQLREFLFKKIGITPHRYTRTGKESTDADQLALAAEEHEAVRILLKLRKIEKMLSSFVSSETGLLAFADDSGVIHPTFNAVGTVTGRFSAQLPNVQQIPNLAKDQWKIRSGFIAQKGNVIIDIDYSQMELRVMAMLTRDQAMADIYRTRGDIHQITAQSCGITRQMAKVVNFGLLYGMGAAKLAYTLTMEGNPVTVEEAQKYINRYFSTYQRLRQYRYELFDEHDRFGFIQYLSGRPRRHPVLLNPGATGFERSSAQREILNNQDQGSCADWVKSALIRISQDKDLKKMGVFPIFQVHDELAFECPKKHADEALDLLKRYMNMPPLHLEYEDPRVHFVPMETEGGYAERWSDVEKK